MPTVNPSCYHISASSIAAFKMCPQKFRLEYREGLRRAQDTEALRVGTNWHKLHEIFLDGKRHGNDDDTALASVVDHLNKCYAGVPITKTAIEWAVEREVLLQSFVGYLWYWQNDPIETLASEVKFDLPVYDPRVNMPLPISEVMRVGKIDHIAKWQGAIVAVERKSTSRAIDPSADYWDRAKKDTQVSMYAAAFKELWRDDGGGGGIVGVGAVEPGQRFGNTLYDVWHKPTIKTATLTQKETAEFLTSGKYFESEFKVELFYNNTDAGPMTDREIKVDGSRVEVEEGKKGFAIRETPAMYGARLLADIMARPAFYYQRKEIVRTEAELEEFKRQVYAVYQGMKFSERTNSWWENESQCRATFSCPNIPICYGAGAAAVCDGKTTPEGYKRIFVDLAISAGATDEG